jgi:hypothetical protein
MFSEMRDIKAVSANDMELLLRTKERNPILFNRMMELLQIVNEPVTRKADDVEFSVIDNLRQMGKEALTSWAEERSDDETNKALNKNPELKRAGKKNCIGKRLMDK